MVIQIQKFEIKGLIYGKFGNLTAFANAIGWTKQKLNKILHGKQTLKAKDLQQMAQALKISMDELATHFLPDGGAK